MTDPATLPAPSSRRHFWPWILLAVVILFSAGVRIRLLDLPLERDEGEYAYAGQLMLQGIPPYQLAYNMKLPGIHLAYAAILAVFGQTDRAVHLGLLLVNASSVLLLFLVGRRLFNSTAGLLAAACYAVMTLSSSVSGLAAHATNFVVLPMLGGILCLLYALDSNRRLTFLSSGMLFGLAFLMKQHGVAFGVFAGLWIILETLLSKPPNWPQLLRRIGLFSVGCILPYAICCLLLWRAHAFDSFWYWTVHQARAYLGVISLGEGWELLCQELRYLARPFWPLAILGAISLPLLAWRSGPQRTRFLLLFLVASIIAVCPGLAFREHYFILLLPAFCLLIGAGATCAAGQFGRAPVRAGKIGGCLAIALVVAALVFSVVAQRQVLFLDSLPAVTKSVYGRNPFIEAREIGLYLRDHSSPDARLFVLGSEPEIYFYARRHSASGFIYMYDLVQNQPLAAELQQRLIREVSAAPPDYLLLVNIPTSWLPQPGASLAVLDWAAQYCAAHYELAGLTDLVSPIQTTILWGPEAAIYAFQSPYRILVFKRKSNTSPLNAP